MSSLQFQFAITDVAGRLPRRFKMDVLTVMAPQTPDKTVTPFTKLALVLREMEHQLGEDTVISIAMMRNFERAIFDPLAPLSGVSDFFCDRLDESREFESNVTMLNLLRDTLRAKNYLQTSESFNAIFEKLLTFMSHPIFKVRKLSLECLGIMYFWNMRQSITNRHSSFEMFINFTLDVHAQVRKVAVNFLKRIASSGLRNLKLKVEKVDRVIYLLKDSDDDVRLAGMDLVYILATSAGDQETEKDQLNSVFSHFSTLCIDPCPRVRTRAFELMKTFKDVPQSMILQLLDKRVKKTSVQVDATSETHIAPSLGIFVHGLEDEFELVRLATLDAIMQITRGVSDPSIFLEEVVELIIDMFNDEMHSVRLMAVQSLAQLGQSSLVPIVESQLLFVLTAFNDASEEIREGTFLALRGLKLDSVKSLRRCVDASVLCMKEHGSSMEALKTLQILGKNHGSFVDEILGHIQALSQMAPHFSSITIECMAYTTLYFGSSPTDASADLTAKRDFISEKYNLVFEPIPVATSSLSRPLASSEYTLIKFLREDFASIQSLCASRKNATAINTINNCQRDLKLSERLARDNVDEHKFVLWAFGQWKRIILDGSSPPQGQGRFLGLPVNFEPLMLPNIKSTLNVKMKRIQLEAQLISKQDMGHVELLTVKLKASFMHLLSLHSLRLKITTRLNEVLYNHPLPVESLLLKSKNEIQLTHTFQVLLAKGSSPYNLFLTIQSDECESTAVALKDRAPR